MWTDRDGFEVCNIPNAIEDSEIGGEPRRFFWSVEAFQCLDKTGLWNEAHLELIEGVIYERARTGRREAFGTSNVVSALIERFGSSYSFTTRLHTVFGERSMPAPDIAVYQGKLWQNDEWPRDQKLIVELCELSLEFGQTTRAALYARFGVPELWLLDLQNDRLEVRREPQAQGYASVQLLGRGERVSPLELPHVSVEVAELLP